jgi:2-keto-4-pentenoate hydratase
METAAVEAILAARRARTPLAPLADPLPDEAAGYAAQRLLAERLGALPPAGFKIGATAKAMQDYLGLRGPVAGFVEARGLRASPAAVRFADFVAPGVECEIGVRLARDIPAGAISREAAAEAVAEVFPAIEIVERRYAAEQRDLGTPLLIADQVFHAGGVRGEAALGWRALDLGAARGEIFVRGASRGVGHGRDLLGHPFDALAWLADSGAARAFGGLRAGQFVWLGSVTPPIWLDGPGDVVVAFEDLGKATLRFTVD